MLTCSPRSSMSLAKRASSGWRRIKMTLITWSDGYGTSTLSSWPPEDSPSSTHQPPPTILQNLASTANILGLLQYTSQGAKRKKIVASNNADAGQSFLCLSMERYHYDDPLIMYSKLRAASTSERATFSFCPGMWGVHEMYAFTKDGRLRIAAFSTCLLFFSICMGIGRNRRVV